MTERCGFTPAQPEPVATECPIGLDKARALCSAGCCVACLSARGFKLYTQPPAPAQPEPIDMVLHCPKCGMQHVDAPDGRVLHADEPIDDQSYTPTWNNPPHRSHLCHGCGHIWRPADVSTNGVDAVKTKGKADSPIATQPAPVDERAAFEAAPVPIDAIDMLLHKFERAGGPWKVANFGVELGAPSWAGNVENALAELREYRAALAAPKPGESK